MLLSYGAKNFFCFKEWVIINLAFNSKVPQDVSHGQNAALSLCLKGGNASGKTNALKILVFLSEFCANSFNEKPDAEIHIDTFFNNKEPTEFYIHFTIGEIEYFYELSLTAEGVISEKIFKKEQRKTLVFHRTKETIQKNLISDAKDFPVRKNASYISTLKQFEINAFEPFYNFFNCIFSNIDDFGNITIARTHGNTSKFYSEHKDYLDFTKKYLERFDTGIIGLEISTYKKDNAEVEYFPLFFHKGGHKQPLLYYNQSSGTRSLYNILRLYYAVLKSGSILVLDEFDINLHPDILPHLVELFENKETNPKNAQLLFSTHNTDIIDLMGKYRTYLFNKKDGECFSYRLDEMSADILRNDRPISPIYKSGKIGGVPKI